MYFDEELTLTESECSVVEKEECNLETVVRQVEQEVTDCGTVEEEICLNVMDTKVEEEPDPAQQHNLQVRIQFYGFRLS